MTIRNELLQEKKRILSRTKDGTFVDNKRKMSRMLIPILGIINLVVGTYLTWLYATLNSIKIPYSQLGTFSKFFTVAKAGNYKIYVEIENFYQNYLGYAKSISYDQMRGDATNDIKVCDPLERRDGKIIYPCGLIANTFFADDFVIVSSRIDTKNIIWKGDRKMVKPTNYDFDKIVSPPNWAEYTEKPDLSKNERFINWIDVAAFPSFKKLMGRVDLEKGRQEMIITSFFPYGRKTVAIEEVSWAGTKNLFLSVFLICVGVIMLTSYLILLFE